MSCISNMSSTENRNIHYIKPTIHLSPILGQGDILGSAFKWLVPKYKTKTMPPKNLFKASTTNKACKNKIIVKLDYFGCDSQTLNTALKAMGLWESAQWEYLPGAPAPWKGENWSAVDKSLLKGICDFLGYLYNSTLVCFQHIWIFHGGKKQILKSKHYLFLVPGTIFRLCCHTTNW